MFVIARTPWTSVGTIAILPLDRPDLLSSPLAYSRPMLTQILVLCFLQLKTTEGSIDVYTLLYFDVHALLDNNMYFLVSYGGCLLSA